MKTKNILLLSLVSLALVGCGKNSDTSVNSTKASDAPISSKTSTAPQSSEKKDSTISKDSETSSSASTGGSSTSSSGITTSTSESASESVSTDIYSTTLWPTAVVDAMLLHLGNRIVPYVDLGISTSKLNPDWDNDTDTLTILGGLMTGGLSDTRINTAKDDYEDEGWTVTIKDNSLTAVNADGDLTVKYYTEDDLCYFTVKYAEAFDPTKASSWPTDLMNEMNTNMNNHGADIPFVYLGTVAPSGSFADGSFTIEGGAWDDQITSLAETAFTAANTSITDEAYKWTFSTGTNYYGTTFKASVTLADGTVLKVSIEAPSTYYSTKRVSKMVINYKEPFVAPATGSWPTEISDVFNTDFDGHSIPWFYTGGTPSLYSHASGSSNATIYGVTGSWDDQIYTLCQTAIDNENATITDDANKWTSSSETLTSGIKKVTYVREFADECSLKFTIENYSTSQNKAEIHVYYTPKFVVPSTQGDWEQSIKDMFTADFGGHAIPWFYTGGTTSIYTHTSGSSTATLCGQDSTWNDKILTLAQAAFEAENTSITDDANKWKLTVNTTYSYGQEYNFERTFEDNCKMSVAVRNYSSYSNKAEIKITYTPAFVVPTTGDWSTEIKQVFTDFDGHSIPWFYMGGNPSLKYYYTGDTYANIDAPDNTWDDQILTLAQTACENENATISDDANKWVCTLASSKLTCTRLFEDGCTIKFTVANYSTYYNYARVTINYQAKLVVPATGSWNTSISDVFTNKFDGHAMPWFYAGCDPTLSSSTDYTATIYGTSGTWNDQILSLAETACENENATITNDANKWVKSTETTYYGTKLIETRTFEDGCTLKFTVENYGTSSNKAEIHVYYTPSLIYPTGDEAQWSDTVKTKLESFLGTGETIPWIYLNAAKDKVTNSYDGSSEKDFKGGAWDDKLIDYAITELTNANEGWSCLKNTYDNQMVAVRTTAAGKNIKLVLKSSSNVALLEVYCK